ncbi:tripartite tricarboxylate transporter permease [Vibrio lentus]|uniref:tripartite tricarboxylate transporter permease n=1 Tax=Vibrio lentus TaxID=136468 RepID=UPI0039A53D25
MLDGILQGLSTAVMPMNIMMVIVGCFVGTFIGMLPGLGPISAIAFDDPYYIRLRPFFWPHLNGWCVLRRGFWWIYVINLNQCSGCSSTVVTAFDGYPMAQKGQAGKNTRTRGLLFFHWWHALSHYAVDCSASTRKRVIELSVF